MYDWGCGIEAHQAASILNAQDPVESSVLIFPSHRWTGQLAKAKMGPDGDHVIVVRRLATLPASLDLLVLDWLWVSGLASCPFA